ncbi:hypothetical protein IAR50_005266 [Cryptococcus sp. DSM 104548]
MAMSLGAARRGKPKIRPPKKISPEASIDEIWRKLSNGIREIQNHNASKLSFEEHYRYGHNMVLFKRGDQLFKGVKELITEHLNQLAQERIVPTFPRSGGTRGAGKLGGGEGGIYGGGAEAVERALEGDRFLKALKGVWEDHIGSMRKLKAVLQYMDRNYSTAAGLPPIYDVGLSLFLIHIIRSPLFPIHTHLISTLLSQVSLERDGESITRSTVRECTDVLQRLHISEREVRERGLTDKEATVYTVDFEPEFLRRSGEFYEYEAGEMLAKGDAAAYLKNVERRLREESDRTLHYLSTDTHPALHALLIDSLLTPHLSSILHMPGSGLQSMVERDRYDDLKRLYDLFCKVPEAAGKEELRRALRSDVETRGKGINAAAIDPDAISIPTLAVKREDTDQPMASPSKPAPVKPKTTQASALASALRWVQDVLDLKDKFDLILEKSFADDKQVQMSINEAFQSFINANARAAEYLSLFIDENLKKGSKTRTEDEVEQAKSKTLILFRFLTDKDKFERYYKNHLARRLLYSRSASDDAEQEMVGKLKKEMGFQFTHKLEGMFTDMRVSKESDVAFRKYEAAQGVALDLSVSILTSSHWPQPIVAPTPCTFPPALNPAMSAFQKYYDSRHSGRRLTWQVALGTADVKCRFKKGVVELNVSTQALVVLLQFEKLASGDILSYTDLQRQTGLPEGDLVRTLQSLACGKYRVLTKHPKGKDVNPKDTFEFNEGFVSPLARIKIMQVAGAAGAKVESGKEREETEGMVEEERRHQIEACIVRIMKDRKRLNHNELVSEVAHQLSGRFSASVGSIKKRIEGLIDREYLERIGEGLGAGYQYLA